MDELKLSLEFFSNWHCGSGSGERHIVDAAIVKDGHFIPYVPGRTVKGVLREAVDRLLFLSNSKVTSGDLFGNEGQAGNYFVSDFSLEEALKPVINERSLSAYLTNRITSTAINDETGGALTNSLRTSEVAIPLKLYGYIQRLDECVLEEETIDRHFSIIEQSLPFFYIGIGNGRRRGLGRVKASVISGAENAL